MHKLILSVLLILSTGCSFISCNRSAGSNAPSAPLSQQSHQSQNKTINSASEVLAKPEVPVLCYHRIEDGRKDDYTVSPAQFEAQISALADSGYHAILPDQLYEYLAHNEKLPSKPVMITFDDSRVEHALIAAPVLEKHGFRGVFFIMTITYNKKNYMTKEQIAELAKAGHTVGLHTWDHTMVTKYKEEADWKKEITDPKKGLEEITGKPVEYLAYPYGIWNHQAAEELHKQMKLSFTLISKRDSVYPLQTVRRMIAPAWTPQGLIKAMHKTFEKKEKM
jgi:peptidoglycan/xylan/chitin deacetylase (PgdA/CDA1 family)